MYVDTMCHVYSSKCSMHPQFQQSCLLCQSSFEDRLGMLEGSDLQATTMNEEMAMLLPAGTLLYLVNLDS